MSFFTRPAKPARGRRLTRRLQLESLETRELLAGNVTAVVDGTTLRITGDAAANSINLVYTNGGWTIRSHVAEVTTINGGAGPVTFFQPIQSLVINMGGGIDYVGVNEELHAAAPPTVLQSLTMNLGAGTDETVIDRLSVNQLRVLGGDAEDHAWITVSNVVSGLIQLGSGGNQLLELNATDSQAIRVEGHIAGDTVSVTGTGSGIAQLAVHTGNGSDRVTLKGKLGSVQTFLGEQSDSFEMDQGDVQGLLVDAAGGDDQLQVTDTFVYGDVRLLGGAGDEHVRITTNYARTTADPTGKLLWIGGNLLIDLGEGQTASEPLEGPDVEIGAFLAGARTSDVTVGGQLLIQGGSGDEGVGFATLAVGRLGIDFKAGRSDLSVSAMLVRGNAWMLGGNGIDRWHIDAFAIRGDMNLYSHGGNDVIDLNGRHVLPSEISGNLTINTGDGADLVCTGVNNVHGGPSNSALSAANIRISTGLGSDGVRLTNLRSLDDFFVALGEGNDSLMVLYSAAQLADFDGKSGDDTLDAAQSNPDINDFGELQQRNFEHVS